MSDVAGAPGQRGQVVLGRNSPWFGAPWAFKEPRIDARISTSARCAATCDPERRRRSTGGPVLRKDEPTATISGKCLSVRTGTVAMLSSPSEHGPGHFPAPQHARPGPFSPKASGAPMGAVLVPALRQHDQCSECDRRDAGRLGGFTRRGRNLRPAPRRLKMTSDFGVTRAM
jgi:hypothetical protein